MALDVNAVMDAIGVRLATISGLEVYDYPADTINVPAAVVSHPETVTYDVSYARGADMAVFNVLIIAGKVDARSSRDRLEAYRNGTGASSIKTVIEADPTLAGVSKTVRVVQATAQTVTVAGIDYAAATFDIEVYA